MTRTLYFARHGETDWNRQGRWQGHTDVPLNDDGRRQAAALGQRLVSLRIARVVSSDLSRARETAEIVARALGMGGGVLVDADLRERSFGVFEGLTREECLARHPEEWARYDATREPPPGGEEFAALQRRMVTAARRAVALDGLAALDALEGATVTPASETQEPDAGAVLLVSHGGAIRSLIWHVTGEMPPPVGNGALFHVRATPQGFEDIRAL